MTRTCGPPTCGPRWAQLGILLLFGSVCLLRISARRTASLQLAASLQMSQNARSRDLHGSARASRSRMLRLPVAPSCSQFGSDGLCLQSFRTAVLGSQQRPLLGLAGIKMLPNQNQNQNLLLLVQKIPRNPGCNLAAIKRFHLFL